MQKTINLISLCLLAALAGCGLSTNHESAQEISADVPWHTYHDEDGTISVEFPGAPEVQHLTLPSPVGQLHSPVASYQGRGYGFNVGTVKYPVDPSQYNVSLGLKGAINGAKLMTGGTVLTEEDIYMFGLPGKEVTMTAPLQPATRIRVFIDGSGPTLYQAQVLGRMEDLNSDVAEKFFDSLTIHVRTPLMTGHASPSESTLAGTRINAKPKPARDRQKSSGSSPAATRTVAKRKSTTYRRSSSGRTTTGPVTVTNPYVTSD